MSKTRIPLQPGASAAGAALPPSPRGQPAKRVSRALPWLPLVFAGGLALGWAGHAQRQSAAPGQIADQQTPQLLRQPRQGLAHPLLACEGRGDDPATAGLRAEVGQLIAAAKAAGKVAQVSVIYQDLEMCRGFSIEPDQLFRPASLLKLPLAMAVLQRASHDPAVLQRELPFAGPTQREDEGPHALAAGQSYAVGELLARMIRWSRNDAKALLAAMVGDAELRNVYKSLDVLWPYGEGAADAAMSGRHIARILRTLYDASWLDAASSDLLLQLLAESEHRAALPSGVPAGVKVSHKWGHRLVPGAEERHHFHDCGILHLPERPLLLCVLTEGRREPDLHALIGQIARVVVADSQRPH